MQPLNSSFNLMTILKVEVTINPKKSTLIINCHWDNGTKLMTTLTGTFTSTTLALITLKQLLHSFFVTQVGK